MLAYSRELFRSAGRLLKKTGRLLLLTAEKTRVCPKCGTPMQRRDFGLECPGCGLNASDSDDETLDLQELG